MNDPSIINPTYQALTDQQLSIIDELCDRFDRELVNGDGPRIETFLAKVPEAARDGLLAELLAMEIEYRLDKSEVPKPGEYIPRFPEQERIISRMFARDETTRFPGNVSIPTQVTVPPGMGNFEIVQTIGKGGMGIVLKAHDKKLKRDVAIKVLAPHLTGAPEAVQRFLREAQSAAAVRHDNVVTIYAVEEAKGIPFLVMELINGESLEDRVKRGPLSSHEILQFGIQIASGLDAAHRRGLIHRDIKPANILLERQHTPGDPDNVRVKITDFGLARVTSESAITRSGFIAGTPLYMSPEQANGKPLDHRSDLFSLGSVLYSLCTGQAAFHAEAAIAVLRRVTDHEPEPIQSLNPTIPDWMCKVIAKLMAKRPEDRIQTAKEVADLLTRCQASGREPHDGPATPQTLLIGESVPPNSALLENSQTTARLPVTHFAPKRSSRGFMTARLYRTLIAAALLTGVMLAVVFSRGRNPVSSQANRDASVPGASPAESIAANDVRELKHPESSVVAGISKTSSSSVAVSSKELPEAVPPPAGIEDDADVAIVFLEGNRRRDDRPDHGVEVHVVVKGGEQITRHAKRMDFEFLKRNTLLDPYFSHGWWKNSDTDWSDIRAMHFQAGVNSNDAIWGVSTNRQNSLVGSVILATGPEDKNPFFEPKNDRVQPYGPGQSIRVHTTDNGNPLSVANGSVYLSDRGWLELCWMGEKESLINSHKIYYLPAGPTLHDLGLRTGTSQTWEDDVFGTVKLLIQPKAEDEIPKLRQAGNAPFTGTTRNGAHSSWHGWPTNAPGPAIAPFDDDLAKQYQKAWADYLKLPVEYTNSIGIKFRLIPPGEFLMGSTPEEIEAALRVADSNWREHIRSEGPQHKVVLTKPLYFGVTKVTQKQYERVMGNNPSHFSATGKGKDLVANVDTGDHPVEMVSWNDAVDFCVKLSDQEKLKPFHVLSEKPVTRLEGAGYRLPTEAEWEYACRAGTTTRFWSGNHDQDLMSAGWYIRNAGGRTHAAGESMPNPFGLSDMYGNVWESVLDGSDRAFYAKFQTNVAIDPFSPILPGQNPRLLRGGDWHSAPFECRSAQRLQSWPNFQRDNMGFRVVLVAETVTESHPAATTNPP